MARTSPSPSYPMFPEDAAAVTKFGDAQTALADMGLQQVQMVEPISEE